MTGCMLHAQNISIHSIIRNLFKNLKIYKSGILLFIIYDPVYFLYFDNHHLYNLFVVKNLPKANLFKEFANTIINQIEIINQKVGTFQSSQSDGRYVDYNFKRFCFRNDLRNDPIILWLHEQSIQTKPIVLFIKDNWSNTLTMNKSKQRRAVASIRNSKPNAQ